MKNFLRSVLLLISVSSIIGIVFVAIYYVYKNLDLFKSLINSISSKVEDSNLTDKEIDAIAKNVVKIEKKIEKDIKNDVKSIKRELPKQISQVTKSKRTNDTAPKGGLNARQKEVLNYVKSNSDSKMSSVSKVFNKVTPRTLRRDLQKLEQMGFLRQQGKTRDAVYKIV